MYNLSGWHEHSLDDKGRMSMPAAFREKLAAHRDDRVYATRSLSGPCVEVYPESEWLKLLEKVAGLSQANPQVIQYRRRFISAASELGIDKAGRVLLPQTLRIQCGLDKDVLIAGNIEKMEVWDRATFFEKQEAVSGLEVLQGMAELGF